MIVDDDNPVVEWCIMPFEPESQEEDDMDKNELLDNLENAEHWRDKYKARIEALERALCDIATVVAKTCDI